MKLLLIFFLLSGCAAGLMLFRKNSLPIAEGKPEKQPLVSVIIPARNEEKNLPHLLASLQRQTYKPMEIIVADDGSADRTAEIAEKFGARVVRVTEPPENWTGKTWAVWNGYLQSRGELLAFLDADIRLAPEALARLLRCREKEGGALSVVPFHRTEKWYERLALLLNLLSIFVFTSPFEKNNPKKGLYGSCIFVSRSDYEKIGGHASIRSEVVEDLNLGRKFMEAGIPVRNYIGEDTVRFRMYPGGLKSELEGFAKSAAPGVPNFRPATLAFIIWWLAGLVLSAAFPFFIQTKWFVPLLAGYFLYMLEIMYLARHAGNYGFWMPVFYLVPLLFFLTVMLYSTYQTHIRKKVLWKGRYVKVGKRKV
ncbi:MAG: glycosyl transferase family 2 [Caldibacillus debilis]|uniref:glycosyltransferase n=1 Tax=Caldibacillus debilis TaxID=301148 RepID=UPI000E37E0C5|nr:glycosyltransferase [Caldibacillus debilis]REJ15651.1 MAG: glycosyl transferase family 2 [Caldibacillus debilis]